jgi:hypothetical protein
MIWKQEQERLAGRLDKEVKVLAAPDGLRERRAGRVCSQ